MRSRQNDGLPTWPPLEEHVRENQEHVGLNKIPAGTKTTGFWWPPSPPKPPKCLCFISDRPTLAGWSVGDDEKESLGKRTGYLMGGGTARSLSSSL